ncbi:DUF1176 domain-containing protein [Klebsiella pneumoniae]|nr:DUF1176 domain-containing protein [Klebsiella pneumoniae]
MAETAWVGKGEEPPLSVPPAPALRAVASAETAPSRRWGVRSSTILMDYGNERMISSHCSLDPFHREIRVTALTDGKVLLMTSCESGAYNTVWLAWLVSRQRPYVARQVRLTLPFQPPGEAPREIELINASYDDRRHELVTLDKGRGAGDCRIQARWRFDGQRFSLSRATRSGRRCDDWQGPDALAHAVDHPLSFLFGGGDDMVDNKAKKNWEQLLCRGGIRHSRSCRRSCLLSRHVCTSDPLSRLRPPPGH